MARQTSSRSLKVSDAFRSFVLDQLSELGEVTPRSMFGGIGLYLSGVFFGIIARDTLYLKVDAHNLPASSRRGPANRWRPPSGLPNRKNNARLITLACDRHIH